MTTLEAFRKFWETYQKDLTLEARFALEAVGWECFEAGWWARDQAESAASEVVE